MNRVASVPLRYSNHSGVRRVLIEAPDDTGREILDRAALAVQQSNRFAGNPALWYRAYGYDVLWMEIPPDGWGTDGRSRLLGSAIALDDALGLIPAAVDALRKIDGNVVIYGVDDRAKARAAIVVLRPETPRCPDCGEPWRPSSVEIACPSCGLSLDDLTAAAAFLDRETSRG